MSEVQHSASIFKAATATVIRALDGLDLSSKLAVLALAGRVTLRTHSGALFFDPASTPLEVGQFWITPKQRIANRTIVLITDTDIGFDNRRGVGWRVSLSSGPGFGVTTLGRCHEHLSSRDAGTARCRDHGASGSG